MARLKFEEFITKQSCLLKKHRPYYVRWASKFINYCKRDLTKMSTDTEEAFLDKHRENGIPEWQLRQASHAIHLYLRVYVPMVTGESVEQTFTAHLFLSLSV